MENHTDIETLLTKYFEGKTTPPEDEKAWLNAYHKQVYDIIAPHLTKEEEEWLRIYTREI